MSRRNQRAICGVAVVAGIVLAYVMLALTPSLLVHHDVLLETLAGSATSIVTGGAYARVGIAPLWLVSLAPFAGIPMYGVIYWWAGRLWGDKILEQYTRGHPRRARFVGRFEAAVRRWGVWALIVAAFLPVPTVAVEVICGISGMTLGLYLIGEIVGLALWEGMLIGLGYAIGHPAVHVVRLIGHYSLWATIGIVVIVVVFSTLRQLRIARDPDPTSAHRQSSKDLATGRSSDSRGL